VILMVALGQKEPAGQATGAVELTGQYCVGLHGVEAVERAAQYAPAGHTEMVLVVGQNDPEGHALSAVEPAGQKLPVLHGTWVEGVAQ
jgi:hypothetical protein